LGLLKWEELQGLKAPFFMGFISRLKAATPQPSQMLFNKLVNDEKDFRQLLKHAGYRA
jgi:hypothetical protein